MDRFIVLIRKSNKVDYKSLKSNMDRFIAICFLFCFLIINTLKSNMDRFIENYRRYPQTFYSL